MRDAPAHMLQLQTRLIVDKGTAACATAKESSGFARGVVFYEFQNLRPGFGITDMRIHIDDEIIIHAPIGRLLLNLCENVTRMGKGVDDREF